MARGNWKAVAGVQCYSWGRRPTRVWCMMSGNSIFYIYFFSVQMPLSFYIVYLLAQMMLIKRESVWAKEKLQRPGACVVLGRPRKLWLLSLCFSFPCWKEGAIIFPRRSIVKMHVFRLCGALGINDKISYSVWMCGLNKACKPLTVCCK